MIAIIIFMAKRNIYQITRNLGLSRKEVNRIISGSANTKPTNSSTDLYKAGTDYGTVGTSDIYKSGTRYGTVSRNDIYKAGTRYGTISPYDLQ